jgi:hypothetical protein
VAEHWAELVHDSRRARRQRVTHRERVTLAGSESNERAIAADSGAPDAGVPRELGSKASNRRRGRAPSVRTRRPVAR